MAEIIILMGPQGAGKGTQAQMLAEKFSLPIVATGEMLREVAKSDSPLGHRVKEFQESGNLVSDDILAEVISHRTSQEDCKRGYVLDGFPRTAPQTELLEQIAAKQGHNITVIKIKIPHEFLYKRLAGRRTCSLCGHIYNIYFKPSKQEGVCDVCGGELFTRSDDKEDAIRRRLSEYTKKTKPLVQYYAQTGRMKEVSGLGTPEEVFAAMCKIVEQAAQSH
ncbi:MAG: adenylate kinase [Acidobacteria bacterium]|nr:adenylate kinase [Acidobacteriota bacterium]